MTGPRLLDASRLPLEPLAEQAADALAVGELVVLPTDTVYGLAARADDEAAVARLFEAKGRPADRPLPVLLASAEEMNRAARDVPPAARTLARAFWPGPLTIVLPRADAVPRWVTAGADTVGLRVPDDPVALAVLARARFLVAVTSANPSDSSTPATARQAAAALLKPPALVIEAGPREGKPSTVVAVGSDGLKVLREGPVSETDLRRVLAEAGGR